ncbi:hypothetical protein SPBR_09178 [Sporothrix brasiliensis 5110]|uniref:Aminoglycoside phosphotransferase domain-containing protein n=1 Tax=Sporothrix brasiliensis 5110 TaxID=1398154 RepID=A0A0C2J9I2_9PEZI|nr:uncharacterized protein SPBR_09178 [Sporothrix brasiliensis 5110]KIH93607.1 hypothetical protein SPBR_09178 [Sporothrix brasiliensis 5110]
MRYVAAKTSIPVPHVYHYGIADENPVGLGPFIIMDYIDHYETLSVYCETQTGRLQTSFSSWIRCVFRGLAPWSRMLPRAQLTSKDGPCWQSSVPTFLPVVYCRRPTRRTPILTLGLWPLPTFLSALEEVEKQQQQQQPASAGEPLSKRMRTSWTSNAWMRNYAARRSWAFDTLWWKHVDDSLCGPNEDQDHKTRLAEMPAAFDETRKSLYGTKMQQSRTSHNILSSLPSLPVKPGGYHL